jgi:hypothetical protein
MGKIKDKICKFNYMGKTGTFTDPYGTEVTYGPTGQITVKSIRMGIEGLTFATDLDGNYVQQGVPEGKTPIIFNKDGSIINALGEVISPDVSRPIPLDKELAHLQKGRTNERI